MDTKIKWAGLGQIDIDSFSTPRRFNFFVEGISDRAEDKFEEIFGPPEKAAFKDGKPTKAAEGFARKNGKSVDDIEIRDTDKGRYCFLKVEEKGRTAKEILAEIIPQAIAEVGAPKSMTWIPGNKFAWPRPIRHILALLDDEVIEFDFHGIPVGRITRGHPFHGRREIEIEKADIDKFKEELEKEYVILDSEERKKKIKGELERVFKKEGIVFDENKLGTLLDEVTNLVEWPEVVVGEFDEEFLELPKEIVQAAMMEHQRYFPVEKEDGTLINKFVTVSNRPQLKDETVERNAYYLQTIGVGNERVIRARLADAKFFYDEDRGKKLEDYVPELAGMVYHAKLGSNLDKVNRLVELCGKIGPMLGYDKNHTELAERAAFLCRADLVTQMVGEFPSLQGVIGSIYAKEIAKEEEPEVRWAIKRYHNYNVHHYAPGFSGVVANILSTADRLDTLVAFFAIGEEPKGNQDPYALRRAVLGLLDSLENKNVEPAKLLVEATGALINSVEFRPDEVIQNVLRFMRDRLYVKYTSQVYLPDHVRSVLERGMKYPLNRIRPKLKALRNLYKKNKSDWFDLVKSVQRCRPGKIAKDLEEKGLDVNASPDPGKFKPEDDEEGKYEHKLYRLFKEVEKRFIELTDNREYVEAGNYFLEKMKDPINEFYDKVFVNVENPELRLNRVRLTGAIYELFAENFADMAEIAGPEKTSEQ